MKLSELQRGSVSTIAAVARELPAGYAGWQPGQEVQLLFSASIQEHIVTDRQNSITINGREAHDRVALDSVAERAQPRLCWIAECHLNNGEARFLIQVHEFAREDTWPDPFPICVDSELVEKVRTTRNARVTVKSILDELRSDFLLPPGPNETFSRALVSMSPEGRAAGRTIRLVGKNRAVDIRMSDQNGVVIARAYRMVQARAAQRNEARYPLWLVHGDVQFSDKTDSGLSQSICSEIDVLVQSTDSYLRVWELYGEMEKKALEEEAEEFGSVGYGNPKQIDELHWSFRIGDDEGLQRCADLLRMGQHKDLCTGGDVSPIDATTGASVLRFSGELVRVLPLSRTVTIQTRSPETPLPPSEGQLVLDLTGDSVRHERRARARESIRSTECPMRKLALILEGRRWTTSYRKKWQKVPQRVLDKFKSAPTEGQLRALLTAINTPDIALIQGPPGTGKTQVISALVTWLSMIREGDVSKTTLLTSFQQDAVDNVAERSRVFGLPPTRIGGHRHTSGSVRPFEIWMAEMRHSIQRKLQEYGQKPVFQALNSVKDIYASYAVAPGYPIDAAKRIEEISNVAAPWLSPDLCDRGLELRQRIEGQASAATRQSGDRAMIEAAVRGLRTEPEAFADDGPRSCFRLLRRLEPTGMLKAEDIDFLVAGSEWTQGKCPEFLSSLRAMQHRLIDALADSEHGSVQRLEIAEVSRYLRDVAEHLQERCKTAMYGKDAVLFQFAAALERDPYGCEQAVEDYAAVLAATVGQSVGREMNRLMDEEACFVNVIVDEAARANPLDLMIPLSRAEKRIILVGDHRQLPHVLEVHIEREVNRSIETHTKELLGKSMFERLLDHVREQERHDGIPRYARLDKQFRMHPALAKFVNDAFYKPYGEEFTSSVSEDDYSQEVAPYGKAVAVWKRMPFDLGDEVSGKSKARPVEARWVAEEALRLLKTYPQYSIGVITFYTAQAKSIENALLDCGVMYIDPTSGEMETLDDYKLTKSLDSSPPRERLRVGTVDAFQGKEFDLVLLSMTRSNRLQASDERAIRRKYGHLVLENRLCVAMSRQKRLLIVAGDDGMLSGDGGAKSVPGLAKFRDFCGGAYGAVV